MNIRYLNVDCILRSDYSLKPLIDWLRPYIFILWEEINSDSSSIGIETTLTNSNQPEDDILKFINLFDRLPPEVRQLLNNCKEKVFDIGFEAINTGNVLDTTLCSSTIQKINNLSFSLQIRIYPSQPQNT